MFGSAPVRSVLTPIIHCPGTGNINLIAKSYPKNFDIEKLQTVPRGICREQALPVPNAAKIRLNSKHEARNSKQIQMTKIQMTKTKTDDCWRQAVFV